MRVEVANSFEFNPLAWFRLLDRDLKGYISEFDIGAFLRYVLPAIVDLIESTYAGTIVLPTMIKACKACSTAHHSNLGK